MKNFSTTIQRWSIQYEKNPTSKIKLLKDKLGETTTILTENVEKLIEKNEKLNIIAQKSRSLNDNSDTFLKNIKEIKRKQKFKKYKFYAIAALFVFIIILLLYFQFIK